MGLAALLLAAGCGKAPASPLEVASADDTAPTADGETEDTAKRADGQPGDKEDSATKPGDGGSAGGKGGLSVVDAAGQTVGWLVQRGHPFQAQDGQPDILQDGVLVYGSGLFFGVAMHSGKVLVPRLGVQDNQCTTPVVAGYYAQGEQVSGMDYGFAYAGKWWRIKAGQKTQLVPCAGVTKQGPEPKCVLHSGTCRGFPVEPVPGSAAMPASFKGPLRFAWSP